MSLRAISRNLKVNRRTVIRALKFKDRLKSSSRGKTVTSPSKKGSKK